jgi:hypothetical protein
LLSPSSSFVGALKAAHVTSELRAQVLMHASSAAANNPASAVMEQSPECALTGEQRALLRRLLLACMMLGATRAQSKGLLAEAAPSLDAIKAFAAAEAAVAVAEHAALKAYEGLLYSAYLIAFHLQLLVSTEWNWLQLVRGDESASTHSFSEEDAHFFRMIHATLCRLHVAGSTAAPFSLLHFLGDPLVSELRAECIRHLNTKGTTHRRHAVDILAILLKLWITPSVTPQGREQWIQNLERSRALSPNARARMRAARTALILSSKAHRDGFLHGGPLYPVQRIPWTNLKLVDSVRTAVGAPNDKLSFQLDEADTVAVVPAASADPSSAEVEGEKEWRRMIRVPTPEEPLPPTPVPSPPVPPSKEDEWMRSIQQPSVPTAEELLAAAAAAKLPPSSPSAPPVAPLLIADSSSSSWVSWLLKPVLNMFSRGGEAEKVRIEAHERGEAKKVEMKVREAVQAAEFAQMEAEMHARMAEQETAKAARLTQLILEQQKADFRQQASEMEAEHSEDDKGGV